MTAGTYNIVIEQGVHYVQDILYKDHNDEPISLDGWSGKMQIRKSYNSPDVIFEFSTDNGKMKLNNPTGNIRLEAGFEDTRKLDFDTAVYDIDLTNIEGVPIRILQGTVTLSREVTR